jgi:hypothetical protein
MGVRQRYSKLAVRLVLCALPIACVAGVGGILAVPYTHAQASRAQQLDVQQGFDFMRDRHSPVGFITSLKVGGTALTADITALKNPEDPGETLVAVAVLTQYDWTAGVTDPMHFGGQVSTANKQKLAEMLMSNMSDKTVELTYVVYDYDPLQKKYFKSASVDGTITGLIEQRGDELNLSIAHEPSSEVESPSNFNLQFGIKPVGSQRINLATGVAQKIVRRWGVTRTP